MLTGVRQAMASMGHLAETGRVLTGDRQALASTVQLVVLGSVLMSHPPLLVSTEHWLSLESALMGQPLRLASMEHLVASGAVLILVANRFLVAHRFRAIERAVRLLACSGRDRSLVSGTGRRPAWSGNRRSKSGTGG